MKVLFRYIRFGKWARKHPECRLLLIQALRIFLPLKPNLLYSLATIWSFTNILQLQKLFLMRNPCRFFSNRFMEPVRQNCTEECYKFVLNALIQYGHYGLFTVNIMSSGLISLNEMPLQLRYQNKDEGLAGFFTGAWNFSRESTIGLCQIRRSFC